MNKIIKKIDTIIEELEALKQELVSVEDKPCEVNKETKQTESEVDKYNKTTIKELESWGVTNTTSTGVKSLLCIGELFYSNKIDKNSSYDSICKAISDHIGINAKSIKVSLSIIRKQKANFNNAIIFKGVTKDNTNYQMLKKFIDIC